MNKQSLSFFKYLFINIIFSSSFLFLFSNYVYASTLVTQDVTQNTTWSSNNSPYIISNPITVVPGVTLDIQPGVTIQFSSAHVSVLGTVNANGRDTQKIYLTSSNRGGINFHNATGVFNNTDISGIDTIDVSGSSVAISNSTIHDLPSGFLSTYASSSVSITNSSIQNIKGNAGLAAYISGILDIKDSVLKNVGSSVSLQVFDSSTTSPAEIHLQNSSLDGQAITQEGVQVYGTAHAFVTDSFIKNFADNGVMVYQQADIHIASSSIESNTNGMTVFQTPTGEITNSSISNNSQFEIQTYSDTPFNAQNNWWGTPAGPGTSVSDSVVVSPWLDHNPIVTQPSAPCCSSVIFIPGIEASRLYLNNSRLWEPNPFSGITGSISSLYLDSSGKSINKITTKDIIDGGFGYTIYSDFIKYMNGLVSAKTINSWEPFPYDWRMDVQDVVKNNVLLSGGSTYNMISEIARMASNSPTGKVSIIAHSNGGLVAKALVKALVDQGRTDLVNKIDKVILVAVPELGTPIAVPALLHGFGQGLDSLGLYLSDAKAREFSFNMPGAYGLLPSSSFFDNPTYPIITFDSSLNKFKSYGSSISDYSTLQNFLLSKNDARTQPKFADILDPTILNLKILKKEEATHALLDSFGFPSTIKTYQIVGQGLDTIDGFTYQMKDSNLDEIPHFTDLGDSTVVNSSADTLSTQTYFVNMNTYNDNARKNISHENVLEIPDLQNLLKNIIADTSPIMNSVITQNILKLSVGKKVTFSIHSPATLNIYDNQGNHTGVIENTSFSSDPDLLRVEETIPNSYYFDFGEGKYSGVSGDNLVTVKLQGTGSGTFTLDVDVTQDGQIVQHNKFANVPVTPSTLATIDISSDTQTPTLNLDSNGDGINDATIQPNQAFDPLLYLQTARQEIISLNLDTKIQKDLLKKIDKMIKLVQEDKLKRLTSKIKNLIKNIDFKKRLKKMSTDDKQNFINILTQFVYDLDQVNN